MRELRGRLHLRAQASEDQMRGLRDVFMRGSLCL